MIEINGLDFSYSEEKVLKDIDLDLSEDKLIGIIGPNGSGKTTLLKCLTGINSVKENKIFIDGEDISCLDRKEIAKFVSVVPQNTNISFDFKVKEIISMGRLPYKSFFSVKNKKNGKNSVTRKAMELTNTTRFKERNATNLSGGELQRVIIARALAQDTPILLMDEPTSHLDINHKIEIMSLAKDLSKQKLLIGVFHDLNLAAQYCDKLILLSEGRIKAKGDPDEVLDPEIIRKAYGVNTIVKKHPLVDSVFITPCAKEIKNCEKEKKTIHVVAGGGTGSKIFYELNKRGYKISTGVINSLDSDTQTANSIGIKTVIEEPFSDISKEKHQKNIEHIKKSDIVILSNLKFGKGNLKNLKAIKKALKLEKEVFSLEKEPIKERDFTKNKKATKIYNKLLKKGMKKTKSIKELINKIKK